MNITSTSTSTSSENRFGFWGKLPLSRKLLLAFGVLFVFAVIIAAITLSGLSRTQGAYEQALTQGIELRRLSDKLSINLLQARRDEKNFLLRWTSEGFDTAYSNYVSLFTQNVAAMRAEVKQLALLGPAVAAVSTGDSTQAQYEADLADLTKTIDTYEQSFTLLVNQYGKKGYDENTGLEGKFRTSIKTIEAKISGQVGLEKLEITLLQIRRNEKDYLSRGDQQYADQINGLIPQLKTQIAAANQIEPAAKNELFTQVDAYLLSFNALVALDKEIFTIDQTLIDSARAVEPLVAKIETLGEQLASGDTDTARADSTQTFTFSIAAVLVVLVISAVLALTLSRQITLPITQLTNTSQQIAEGNFDVLAEVSSADEIGTLAQTFNSMTSRLRQAFEDVRRRATELATVAEVGTATATILETDKLLQEVVNLSKERFNLYHSHIYLLDEAGENLVLASGAGEAGRQMKAKGLSIPLNREQSLVARAARERKGVTVNNVTEAPDFLPNILLPDTRSELAVPMIVGGKVIGVFDVQSDKVGRFTDSDINIQTTLAAQVSTSIQNVRSFEQAKAQADLESMVNAIGQKIQRATTVDDTLQTAIREIGLALGASRVSASITGRQDGSNSSNLN